MATSDRRQREREAVRNQILTAATELFVSEGYANVSMRKIASRMEYSPSSIYVYFRDKEDLFHTIAKEVFDGLTGRLSEIEALQLPPLESLERAIRTYIEFGLEHPHHYKLAFGPVPAMQPAEGLNPAEAAGLVCFETFVRILQRCVDSGDIATGDVEALAQSVWLMAHGVADMLITSGTIRNFPWAEREKLISTPIGVILRGLTAG